MRLSLQMVSFYTQFNDVGVYEKGIEMKDRIKYLIAIVMMILASWLLEDVFSAKQLEEKK